MEITLQDIQNYLATKEDDDIIGLCMDGGACLAHNTLTWKYELSAGDVTALSTHAFVENGWVLFFPQDVEEQVWVFDTLKPTGSPVTKAEFMEAIRGQNA